VFISAVFQAAGPAARRSGEVLGRRSGGVFVHGGERRGRRRPPPSV